MNDNQISIEQFLRDNRKLFSKSEIERRLGMPEKTLQRVIDGRKVPATYRPQLINFIKIFFPNPSRFVLRSIVTNHIIRNLIKTSGVSLWLLFKISLYTAISNPFSSLRSALIKPRHLVHEIETTLKADNQIVTKPIRMLSMFLLKNVLIKNTLTQQ